MKKLLISSALIAGFVFTGCQNAVNTSSNKTVEVTGIRQANLNADSQNLPDLKMNKTQPIPGKVKAVPASFNDAPPMIPHSVEGMVPITKNNNMCLNCHTPTNAKAMKVTAIPASHFEDNFKSGKHTSKLAGSRYNCTLCHAPQAMVDPVIENKFNSLKK